MIPSTFTTYIHIYYCIYIYISYLLIDDLIYLYRSNYGSYEKDNEMSSSNKVAVAKRGMRIRSVSTSSAATRSRIVQSGNRTIYTAGRPPWYNSQGQIREPFVIG